MITVGDLVITPTIFPDGTRQVWKIPFCTFAEPSAHVVWEFENESEFFTVAQLKTLLDKANVETSLEIKYLPYGRQDKEVTNDTTFGLRTFAKLLNTLDFSVVNILDPHSEIALDLINYSHAFYPVMQVLEAIRSTEANLICYPDKGALSKYASIYEFQSIHADKTRDQSTGEIVGLNLTGNPLGKKVLIVDDICDGGATFIRLAKVLKLGGADSVHLFVTHGLFTKGIQVLKDSGISRIFTSKGEV